MLPVVNACERRSSVGRFVVEPHAAGRRQEMAGILLAIRAPQVERPITVRVLLAGALMLPHVTPALGTESTALAHVGEPFLSDTKNGLAPRVPQACRGTVIRSRTTSMSRLEAAPQDRSCCPAGRVLSMRPARKATWRWRRFPNLWCRQQSLPAVRSCCPAGRRFLLQSFLEARSEHRQMICPAVKAIPRWGQLFPSRPLRNLD